MKPSVANLVMLVSLALLSGVCAATPPAKVDLFNGKDLAGFYTWLVDARYEDPRKVFTVTNSLLRISGDGLGYLATRTNYSHYHLVAEFKWGQRNWSWGDRIGRAKDSGLFLHATGPDGNSHDGNGAFMAALECNIFQGATGDFLLIRGSDADGKLIAPKVRFESRKEKDRDGWFTCQKGGEPSELERWGRINWKAKAANWRDEENFRGPRDIEKPYGAWNTLECIVSGSRVVVFLNGLLVNQVQFVSPSAGKILLQCEGSEIFFRRLELLPLKEELTVAEAGGSRAEIGDGKIFIPPLLPDSEQLPVLLHLHGSVPTVERNFARAEVPGVLVTINRPGLSAAYTSHFSNTNVFWRILADLENVLAAQNPPRRIGKLYLSSFSAGFGGVRELLKDKLIFGRIDGLLMADSIYAGFTDAENRQVDPAKMEGFLAFALSAVEQQKWMLLTHSEQPVPDYASTTETADYLIRTLNLSPRRNYQAQAGQLQSRNETGKGNFRVRGFAGQEPEDHLKHLRNIWVHWEQMPFWK